ncbi:MAG: hypothetical protein FJ088_00250 [Deltaproteobacteria bacterium]|nr:hypothetical protein [Deltaproteobacteria bacterium]
MNENQSFFTRRDLFTKEIVGKALKKCLDLGLTYERGDGACEVIDLLLTPAIFDKARIDYIYGTCKFLEKLFLRVSSLRNHIQEIAEILPFEPEEEEFILKYSGSARKGTIFPRWDADLHLNGNGDVSFKFFEVNAVAIGGIHYSPTSEEIILEVISSIPEFGELRKRLFPNPDPRGLFIETCLEHSRNLGDGEFSIAWLEDKRWDEGITEGPSIVHHLNRQRIKAFYCDPKELSVKNGEIYFKTEPVKVIYRNMELRDLIEIEKESGTLDALRHAFGGNRVISSVNAEFDHKSVFEIFTNDRFSFLFNSEETELLKRHIPWTRFVREGKTACKYGDSIDLIDFISKNKDVLVLKPNRACGGEGIVIGRITTEQEWESAVGAALKGNSGGWIVQEYIESANIKSMTLKRMDDDVLTLFTTYGFIAAPGGMGILGRASSEPIVNVSRGGGVLAALRFI